MPIEVASGALRLKPSLRVRLHRRSRLLDLALAMSLATTAAFSGVVLLAPTHAPEAGGVADFDSPGIVEMRSAATSDVPLPVRHSVRVIPLEHAAIGNAPNGPSL